MFYCQCAFGSFIHSCPFRYSVSFITLCSILYTTFHFITTHFISATSMHRTARATHPFHFVKQITVSFHSLAFALPPLQYFLCCNNLQKMPTLKCNCYKPFHSTHNILLHSITALHLLFAIATTVWYALFFPATYSPNPTH